MCGIVGYIGNKQAHPFLIEGLKRLEYRGYDSSGIALLDETQIQVFKKQGKVAEMESLVLSAEPHSTLGVGHTRWATHGVPSEKNAHPHASKDIFVVHNGIVENHEELRAELRSEGIRFSSQTDTEVIAHLVQHYIIHPPITLKILLLIIIIMTIIIIMLSSKNGANWI